MIVPTPNGDINIAGYDRQEVETLVQRFKTIRAAIQDKITAAKDRRRDKGIIMPAGKFRQLTAEVGGWSRSISILCAEAKRLRKMEDKGVAIALALVEILREELSGDDYSAFITMAADRVEAGHA